MKGTHTTIANLDRPAFMFTSLSQHPTTTTTTKQSAPHRPSHIPVMSSQPRSRAQLTHSQTLSSLPDKSKPRSSTLASGSFFTSFFATFTPSGSTTPASGGGTSSNLKSHRSEVELRRDYLSPEREKEIGEIWETFKRQSQDISEDKLTSFPCISEYEYEDQEDEDIHRRHDTRRVIA